MFGFRKKSLVGLDIDTLDVRMVQLKHDGAQYTVAGACTTEIAPWGEDPGLRRIHTVRAIQQGLARGGIDGRLAVCGLRGPEVVVRGFEFPALPEEEIGSAVELEASQICPFSMDESTLDYQVTSTDDKKTWGFWVAASNSLIRSTRQIVHEAGLRCAMIDVAGLALLNNLRGSPEPQTETDRCQSRPAVLDIGGSCTTIAIMDQADRPFVRDLGSGSDDVLRRVAAGARVPLEIVRAALLSHGLARSVSGHSAPEAPDPPGEDEARIWDHLEGACAELLEDIATTLRYYATQQGAGTSAQAYAAGAPCARLPRLLVGGAFSRMETFIQLLRTKLHTDVAPWNPLEGMPGGAVQTPDLPVLLREAGSSMVMATGLAMRHLRAAH